MSILSGFRRILPPPEPPLILPGSEQREAAAAVMAHRIAGWGAADSWPDPYGPDPVVFGPCRRARAEDADYGL